MLAKINYDRLSAILVSCSWLFTCIAIGLSDTMNTTLGGVLLFLAMWLNPLGIFLGFVSYSLKQPGKLKYMSFWSLGLTILLVIVSVPILAQF